MIDWLGYNGYNLVTKGSKEFTDSSGRRRFKGKMDVELAIDALELSEHLGHIVLFSGNGAYRYLVEAVQRRGVRATVVSTLRSQPAMVADNLRRQADAFIDLLDLQEQIEREVPQGRRRPLEVANSDNEVHDPADFAARTKSSTNRA